MAGSGPFRYISAYQQQFSRVFSMKWICSSAAAFVAASSLFVLAGCASGPQGTEQASAPNPCLGSEPATGTMLRRKEDCGGRSGGGGVPDDVKEEIRRAAATSRPMPPGAAGGR
jgi:hypothetical protein